MKQTCGRDIALQAAEVADIRDPERVDLDSTSKLRGINSDSIDLDLDHLAGALAAPAIRSTSRARPRRCSRREVFEASQRSRRVDLDVGEALNGAEHRDQRSRRRPTNCSRPTRRCPEFEPVTMSEVGTKLDLARAYMDMGDPEGARSILDEVVQEGSASQKQEASRLIQSLPG